MRSYRSMHLWPLVVVLGLATSACQVEEVVHTRLAGQTQLAAHEGDECGEEHEPAPEPEPEPDPQPEPEPDPEPEPTPLSTLSDEFDDPTTLANWSRVYQTEGWSNDQLEEWSVADGEMTMMPYSSTWYGDWRGVLAYKEVTGDFVVDARVTVTNRAGDGAPNATYSLAGLMLREPRTVTPASWTPGGENHVFLTVGAAETPGEFRAETKTTVNSGSTLWTTPHSGDAQIRIARIGADIIQLIRPVGGQWTVHERYSRPDLPETLQVGAVSYTDWTNAGQTTPFAHNSAPVPGGTPDLRAYFDWIRFAAPAVPADLDGAVLTSAAVTDAELLAFLTDDYGPSPEPATDPLAALSDEFDGALDAWSRVFEVEGWNADQAEIWDTTSQPGAMTLMPFTSSWYQNWRGILAFQSVTGDFMVETDLTVSNRAGTGAPTSIFSLAGLMIRAPKTITPATWTAGDENYVFASIGVADQPGTWAIEVKTTTNSVSNLETAPGDSNARIRIARIGADIIILVAWPGQPFVVHRRYQRPDFPATLQVGATAYTDWSTVAGYTPFQHNQTVIQGGSPDLLATYEYIRYATPPMLPAAPSQLTDAELAAMLGL